MKNTNVWLYVPKKYHHEQMPPEFAAFNNEAFYILHRIIVGRNNKRHGASKFIPLNAKTLQKFIHPSVETAIRRMLIENRVIECNESYQAGQKSKGYRLTPAYAGDVKRVECTNPTLAAKIVKHRISRGNVPIDLETEPPVYQYLREWLRRVEIAFPDAIRVIERSETTSPELNLMTCETVFHKEWEFHVCKQGRIHTNITRLLSECRECLTIDKTTLINIDIKNSQVVFFALMFMEDHNAPPYPFPPCSTDSAAFDDNERHFIDLTMQGQLYDYLMGRSGYRDSRASFKKKFFKYVLYGNSNKEFIAKTPLSLLFKTEFPSVYDFMLKQKIDGFKRFPCAMQRRESDFMIQGVCERLRCNHPEIPVLTIHDSILTTPEHEETVRRIILEEFRRLGVTPTLSPSTRFPCGSPRNAPQTPGDATKEGDMTKFGRVRQETRAMEASDTMIDPLRLPRSFHFGNQATQRHF